MYAPITLLIFALNLLHESLHRQHDESFLHGFGEASPGNWSLETHNASLQLERYEVRQLSSKQLQAFVNALRAANASDGRLAARIAEFGVSFALDELLATRNPDFLTPYWDYRLEINLDSPETSTAFHHNHFSDLNLCLNQFLGPLPKEYSLSVYEREEAYAVLDHELWSKRRKALEVLRAAGKISTLWQLLLSVATENGKDGDALDYEFCDSMKAWTIWDTTAQSCSAKSSSTEAKRDMSVGNQATRCATACESDTCEQNRPAVLGRENGETTTLAVVQWDASEATTAAYVEKTTTSFVQNRASAKPSIKEALGLVPIAKSGYRSHSKGKSKIHKERKGQSHSIAKKKPGRTEQEFRSVLGTQQAATPVPSLRHWLAKPTVSVKSTEPGPMQQMRRRKMKNSEKKKKVGVEHPHHKGKPKGNQRKLSKVDDLDALLAFLPTPKSPPNTIRWSSKAAFPVVYFTITIVDGPLTNRLPLTNRRSRGARIHLMGLNMPTGYTQITEGRQMRRGTGAVVRTLSPELNGPFVEFKLRVENKYGNACKQLCLDSRQRYRRCARKALRLSTYKKFSDPIPYFKTITQARNAQWTGRGYYRRRKLDYVLFRCE